MKGNFFNIKTVGNQKVRGATKTTVDGIQFDSKLEAYFYSRLKMFKVEFEMQKTYVLQPKFRFRDENIRAVEIVVDFYLPKYNIIVDTKGFQTVDNKIKIKMLKRLLSVECDFTNKPAEILLPSSQKECDAILLKLNLNK